MNEFIFTNQHKGRSRRCEYLLVAKKCPRPTTKDPREPYSTDSRAHGTFLTSRNPRSLKDYEEKKNTQINISMKKITFVEACCANFTVKLTHLHSQQ